MFTFSGTLKTFDGLFYSVYPHFSFAHVHLSPSLNQIKMTEITPVPESLRKAYKEQFCPFGLDNTLPDGGVLLNKQDLLEFIAAQRESAVRERTEEILDRLTASGESQNRAGFKEGLVILEEADYLRKIFLPTSLTPEK